MNNKLKNFKLALDSLKEAIEEPIQSNRDMAGIIQNFEFTYELCWKTLQEHFKNEGIIINTPKSAFKQAYQADLIKNENLWLEIIQDRNLSVHTYDQSLAKKITSNIKDKYFKEFYILYKSIEKFFK